MAMAGRKLDMETGLLTLTDKQEAFLDWLCGGREAGESQASFAAKIGVSPKTLSYWKKDPSFMQRWQERMVASHAHPDTLSRQLEVLNQQALRGDVKSIELYWKLVDKMSPQRVEVSGSEAVAGLSDKELAERLQAAAAQAAAKAEPESPQEQAARVRAELGLRSVG